MEVVLYIYKSCRGTYYCGITNNLIRRVKEHKEGKSKYGKYFGFKEVVYLEWFDSYEEARQRELVIKYGGVKKNWLKIQNSLGLYF